MGYYHGIIDLKDLNLKKTLFSKLNIPIELVIGKINKLFVKVPWQALSSRPVQLEVIGLHLLVKPLRNEDWEKFIENQNKFEVIEHKIISYCLKIF